jgi:hypothetical protein
MTQATSDQDTKNAAQTVKEGYDKAKDKASGAVHKAAHQVHDAADARLGGATDAIADQGERSAKAVRDAAEDYDAGSLQHEAMERVSGFLEDTARSLRSTDLDSVTHEISGFARRHPVAFLAGAAALGFAASRLLRASERPQSARADMSSDQPWSRGSVPMTPASGKTAAAGRSGRRATGNGDPS